MMINLTGTIEFKNDVCICKVKGEYKSNKAKWYFSKIIEELERNFTSNILLDCTEVQNMPHNNIKMFERIDYLTERLPSKFFITALKIAVIDTSVNTKLQKLAEILAEHRGFQFKYFDTYAQAINWLKKENIDNINPSQAASGNVNDFFLRNSHAYCTRC